MSEFLMYKEKPLVRKGNEIYYGDMSEPFVVKLTILSSENEVPNKVQIQLLKSDIQLSEKDRIIKETIKGSMFEALDFGLVWLERALKD